MSLILAAAALFALAFALSAALCGAARVVAPRVGLVDRPGGRKAHRRPTPMGGGVAIWLATVLVLLLGGSLVYLEPAWLPPSLTVYASGLRSRGGELLGILTLATLIMAMGLADDRRALGWKPRLAVQVGLASVFVAVWGGGTLFLPPAFRPLTAALTVLWIVGLTNAFNFLDNMDGLAASVGLIAAMLFAAAQAVIGGRFVPAVLLILAGGLGALLLHRLGPIGAAIVVAQTACLLGLVAVLEVSTGNGPRPERRDAEATTQDDPRGQPATAPAGPGPV